MRKVLLAGCLLLTGSPRWAESTDIEWGFSAGYNWLLKNPVKHYASGENAKFNGGTYTSGTPFPDLNLLKTESFGMPCFDGVMLYNLNDKLGVGGVAGSCFASQRLTASTLLNDGGVVFPLEWDVDLAFKVFRLGARERYRLGENWALIFEQVAGAVRIEGRSGLSWTNGTTGITRTYDATFSGTGVIGMLDVAAEYRLWENLTAFAGLGGAFGAVSTSGSQIGQQTNNPVGYPRVFDHSPSFDFSSMTGKAGLTWVF